MIFFSERTIYRKSLEVMVSFDWMERDHFFQSHEFSHRWGFQGIRKEKTSCESLFIDIQEAPPIAYFKILVPSSQAHPRY